MIISGLSAYNAYTWTGKVVVLLFKTGEDCKAREKAELELAECWIDIGRVDVNDVNNLPILALTGTANFPTALVYVDGVVKDCQKWIIQADIIKSLLRNN